MDLGASFLSVLIIVQTGAGGRKSGPGFSPELCGAGVILRKERNDKQVERAIHDPLAPLMGRCHFSHSCLRLFNFSNEEISQLPAT